MHLKSVALRNFRCFETLDIALHPRLTVLVAENGGGKTSVLDGIAIGLAQVLRYLSSANQRLSGPGIKDTDFRLEVNAGAEQRWVASDYAQVVLTTMSGLQWDVWSASASGKQPEVKIGQSDLATYTANILDSSKTAMPLLLPVFAYYGTQRGRIVIPEQLRKTKVDYSQPTSALVGALESLADFKEMLKWFDGEEAAELRAEREHILRGQGNLFGELEIGEAETTAQWYVPLVVVRSAIISILGNEYFHPHFNASHKFVITSRNGPRAFQLQVSQLSQGYQSMLALAMDFARRLALANNHLYHTSETFDWAFAREYIDMVYDNGRAGIPPFGPDWERISGPQKPTFGFRLSGTPPLGPAWAPAIMLVDEIDLHLHPRWQQRVLADLMRAFPCTQFIVTTHSPQVLTTVRKENIRILERAEDGAWTAREPEISPLGRESGDALAYVMDTHPRPDIPAISPDVYAYEQLARAGRSGSEEARQIKERLDKAGFEFGQAEQAWFDFWARKNAQSAQAIDDSK